MTRHHEVSKSTGVAEPRQNARRIGYLFAATAVLMVGSTAVPAYASAASDTNPDFGPNVTVFDPSTPVDTINSTLESISHETEFSTSRHAVLFKPGTYGSDAGAADPATATGIVNAEIGYYESVSGLGAAPDDVTINGALHAEGVQTNATEPWSPNGDAALTNFWRSMSNLAINPIQRPIASDAARQFPEGVADPHQLRWAVSQAAPLRRVDVKGSLSLFPRFGGYSSGGYLANSKVSGTIIPGSQQQWYTRDSNIGSWDGGVWNMVFSGVQGAPAQSFPTPPETTLASTPISRDAPFLYVDAQGKYKVFVPNARTNAADVSWGTTAADGASIPIHDFFIAKPSNTASDINRALAKGQNLLLTPGVYNLSDAIKVTRSNTVVLGMGFATLTPTHGTSAITVGNVNGVKIAGIIVDAGAKNSATLVKLGSGHANAGSATNPTTLNDVFFRVGGPHAGKATTSLEVNSGNVVLDDLWAWRADHGAGVGWNANTASHGVVVNGNNVTALGLFVEHYQKNQVIWNGDGGQTIFYQSELPYDVPSQAAWMDGKQKGYASYKVANSVTTHSAYGMGVYSFFNVGPDIVDHAGIDAPFKPHVTFKDLVTIFLNGNGSIAHVINDYGDAVLSGDGQSDVVSYPAI